MSKAKKSVALIMGLVMALSAVGCGSTAANSNVEETSSYDEVIIEEESPAMAEDVTNVSEDDASHPTAQDIVDDMIVGWNLGNSLDSILYGRKAGLDSETCWGNPVITKELIDLVKDTGFNAVRVPVTWSNHMDPITNEIDAEWMDRVEEVVNYVLDNDMYCIINVHHDTGEKGWLKASSKDLDAKKKKLEDIWKQLAKRFGAYDDKLLFEGFNEILDEKSEWVNPGAEAVEITNELNQIFVDTVRATGDNNATRCLLVNTYCSGGNNAVTKGFVLPTDTIQNKLIVEAHIYQPFYFVSGTDPEATTWKESKSTIDTYLNNMHQSFVKKGIPVIIGEFGCIDTRSKNERLTWTQYYMDKCDQLGIKCFWWDNGTDYRLFDRNSLRIAEPELIDIMLTEATGGDFVVDTTLYGDADGDGVITNADFAIFTDYLEGKAELGGNCDMNKDGKVDSQDLDLLKAVMEDNSNICNDNSKWSSWVDASVGADADIHSTGNGMEAVVKNSGNNPWEVQICYTEITLEQGVKYKVAFDYSGSPTQNMNVHIMQNYGEYKPYYSESLHYTEEAQHYEITFEMTEATDSNVKIAYDCGASELEENYTIKIENLVLIKISE